MLLREEAELFSTWQSSLSSVPTINSLQQKAEEFRTTEVKKATKKLNGLSDRELEAVERLSRGIVNKLLHGPMSHIRQANENKGQVLKEVNNMFHLSEEESNGKNGKGKK